MIDNLLHNDRRLRMEHNLLRKTGILDQDIIDIVGKFINDYCAYNSINETKLVGYYNDFLKIYSEDLRSYKSDGKYPSEKNVVRSISREQYDVSLILSIFVSKVRHSIMKEIKKIGTALSGKVSVIGIGSGLDLQVLRECSDNTFHLEGYDLEFNKFVLNYFTDVKLFERAFVETQNSYDAILAIELLEHLKNPFDLITTCHKSLKKGGRFIFTTATDMPQFDHLYNFNNDIDFEKKLESTGFGINRKEDYFHNYMGGPQSAKNSWYECFKK